MPLFSQRRGLKPLKPPLQRDNVSDSLRNLLWSALNDYFFSHYNETDSYGGGYLSQRGQRIRGLLESIWRYYFKLPSDSFPQWERVVDSIRKYFFECKWSEVFDVIEYILSQGSKHEAFATICNVWLEEENSAFRIVGAELVEITSKAEIDEIESAASAV